jgi:hypothetical protein
MRAARDLTGAAVPDRFFQMLPQPVELTRLLRLAEDQIWSAESGISGVPDFLPALIAELSWRSRMHMLFGRMRFVARKEIEPRLTLAGFLRQRRLSFGRFFKTFRTKIPLYFRAWKGGRLTLEAIRDVSQQLRKANILFQMVAEQETTWAHDKDRTG